MGEESAELLRILHSVNTNLSEIKTQVERLSDAQARDHKTLTEHDHILVRGSGTSPSLQEVIRAMAKHQDMFIEKIDKERAEAKERLLAEEKRKKEEWAKWKWAIIAFLIATVPKLIWEGVTFYITVIAPTLKKP